MKRISLFVLMMVMALVSFIDKAFATAPDIPMTGVTLPISSITAWFLVIAAGLAIIWGIRKLIKTTNRS